MRVEYSINGIIIVIYPQINIDLPRNNNIKDNINNYIKDNSMDKFKDNWTTSKDNIKENNKAKIKDNIVHIRKNKSKNIKHIDDFIYEINQSQKKQTTGIQSRP